MIEKKIHLIWFGDREKKIIYLDDLKKIYPDYEIKIWGNDDFSFDENIFVKRAFKEKRWSFLSDFYRLKVLYENGGIYLDIDMQPIKSIDEILENTKSKIILSFEYKGSISMGFIAVQKGHPFLKKAIIYYNNIPFVNYFLIGNLIWTEIIIDIYKKIKLFNKFQIIDDLTIYTRNHFSNLKKVKEETYFLHKHQLNWIKSKFLRKIFSYIILLAIFMPVWFHNLFLLFNQKKLERKNKKNLLINKFKKNYLTKEINYNYGFDQKIKNLLLEHDKEKNLNLNINISSNVLKKELKQIKKDFKKLGYIEKISFIKNKENSFNDDFFKNKNIGLIIDSCDFMEEKDIDNWKYENNIDFLIVLVIDKYNKKEFKKIKIVENIYSRLNYLLTKDSVDLILTTNKNTKIKEIIKKTNTTYLFINNLKYKIKNNK